MRRKKYKFPLALIASIENFERGKIMAAHVKVDPMLFSQEVELLRKALATTFTQHAIVYAHQYQITNPCKFPGLARLFLNKAFREYGRFLSEKFPQPDYQPLISMTCIGTESFFLRLEKTITAALNSDLAQQKV